MSSKAKGKEQVRKWLSKGGAAQIRRMAVSELYDVSGVDRTRSSAAGMKTLVSPLLNAKLKLSPHQRATGQCYGGFLEDVMAAGGSEWVREFVDGGGVAGGGASERQFIRMAMVTIARQALSEMKPLRYTLGKSRQKWRGPHRPIPIIDVVDSICVHGRPIEYVAIASGWVTERNGRIIAPDRQRKRIAAGLRHGLDTITDAWSHHNLAAPYDLGMVDAE